MNEHERRKVVPWQQQAAPPDDQERRKVAPWQQQAAPRGDQERRKVAPWQQQAAPRGDAIDRAVREMMSVDADASFRARVHARLERPTSRVFTWSRAAFVAAAAAAVIVAVLLTRTPYPQTGTDVAARRGAPTVATTPHAQPAPIPGRDDSTAAANDPHQPSPGAQRPRSVTRERSARTIAAAVAEYEPGITVDPLAEIEPITVAALEPDPIAPEAIVIAPLAPITEVQIAPLSPQTERD